jgi:hypothetical protein
MYVDPNTYLPNTYFLRLIPISHFGKRGRKKSNKNVYPFVNLSLELKLFKKLNRQTQLGLVKSTFPNNLDNFCNT